MKYEDCQKIFENFMIFHCGYCMDKQYNGCYRKQILNGKTLEVSYIIRCALVKDVMTYDTNVIFVIKNNQLKIPLSDDILQDKNKFTNFIFNIKEKYLNDYEYLLKCAIEYERKNNMEKDFV